jgi:Bacterial extracellular solute-binding proteins, family 3
MGRHLLGLALLLCASSAVAQGPAPLRVGTLEDRAMAAPLEAVLTEGYRRAGLSLRFEPLPLRRAAQMLINGTLDADSLRTPPFFEAHPQVLRVDVPLRHLAYWAHTRPPCGRSIETAQLARQTVAYQRGALVVESWLPEAQRVPVETVSAALQAVLDGKAQASVMVMGPSLVAAAAREYPELCRVNLPVVSLEMFHALAPGREAERERLRVSFESMRRDGSLDRLWRAQEVGHGQMRLRPHRHQEPK